MDAPWRERPSGRPPLILQSQVSLLGEGDFLDQAELVVFHLVDVDGGVDVIPFSLKVMARPEEMPL